MIHIHEYYLLLLRDVLSFHLKKSRKLSDGLQTQVVMVSCFNANHSLLQKLIY